MSGPEWTKTPPTVPGYYWFRHPDFHEVFDVAWCDDDVNSREPRDDVEWWPVPVQTPPEEEVK